MIFFEPKRIYRSSVANVPTGDYQIELGKAEIVQEGSDVTVVGYGAQMEVLKESVKEAKEKLGISCELINLRTILPWDFETVANSVVKTGRLVVSHEAPKTCGFASEVAATIMEKCFLHLEAPIQRVIFYFKIFYNFYFLFFIFYYLFFIFYFYLFRFVVMILLSLLFSNLFIFLTNGKTMMPLNLLINIKYFLEI